MTLEDALALAQRNGAHIVHGPHNGQLNLLVPAECASVTLWQEELLAAFRQVEQDTIERCAKVCEGMPYGTTRGEFANAILALGVHEWLTQQDRYSSC